MRHKLARFTTLAAVSIVAVPTFFACASSPEKGPATGLELAVADVFGFSER